MRALYVLSLGLLIPTLASAGSGPRWSPSQLSHFADLIVLGRVVDVTTGWEAQRRVIYTYVTVDVAEVLKGELDVDRITVKQLGGEADGIRLAVVDQATFTVGEDVLLYLEARPRDGTLYTAALWQGKWSLTRGGRGRQVASRRIPAVHGAAEERQLVSDARNAAAATPRKRSARAITPQADTPLLHATSGFNLLGPYRYVHSPAVDAQSGGQPGLSGGGFAQIRAAIGRWNNAGTPFSFVVGTEVGTARCSAEYLGNGRVTITFMDPCGEMSNTGGTLAMGGSYYVSGGGTSNGQTFERALEGFIINNDSSTALGYLTQPGCFEDVQTHELGHVLGLHHSNDPTALMFSSLDSSCRQGPRGLMPDDVNGVRFIYGTVAATARPPAAAPTDIGVTASGNTLTVSWTPAITTPLATHYQVDFRSGHQDHGPLVAALTTSGTSLTVGVPQGTAGPFNVKVTPLNGTGAGPTSARVDFLITVDGTACSAAPPAVTSLTGAVANGFARAQWAASPGATRYLIQAGSVQGTADVLPVTDIGAHTAASAPVSAGFRAWIRVRAANACGIGPAADLFIQ